MRLRNVGTSLTGPQSSPLLTHDASCGGGPERKAGAAALITAAASPAFGALCRWVLPQAANPWLLDFATPAVLLVLGLALLAVGAEKR